MRLVMSKDISDTTTDLKYRTPFADIVELHLMIDALEDMREATKRESEQKNRRKKGGF